MNLDEIDTLAKKGELPKDNFTAADSCYFWTMKNIYSLFAMRKISVDQARNEKSKARQRHEEHTRDKQLAFETYKQMQDNIKITDGIRVNLAKCNDISEYVHLLAKAVSLLTGDKTVSADAQRKFSKTP